MLDHFQPDRIAYIARLPKENSGIALLDELKQQHTVLLERLQDSGDDSEIHRLQGACRVLGDLILKIEAAPEVAEAHQFSGYHGGNAMAPTA